LGQVFIEVCIANDRTAASGLDSPFSCLFFRVWPMKDGSNPFQMYADARARALGNIPSEVVEEGLDILPGYYIALRWFRENIRQGTVVLSHSITILSETEAAVSPYDYRTSVFQASCAQW
jgi:hypothetical protein